MRYTEYLIWTATRNDSYPNISARPRCQNLGELGNMLHFRSTQLLVSVSPELAVLRGQQWSTEFRISVIMRIRI